MYMVDSSLRQFFFSKRNWQKATKIQPVSFIFKTSRMSNSLLYIFKTGLWRIDSSFGDILAGTLFSLCGKNDCVIIKPQSLLPIIFVRISWNIQDKLKAVCIFNKMYDFGVFYLKTWRRYLFTISCKKEKLIVYHSSFKKDILNVCRLKMGFLIHEIIFFCKQFFLFF